MRRCSRPYTAFVLVVACQVSALSDWRELWIPSFEADHENEDSYEMTKRYAPVVEALQQVQLHHNISADSNLVSPLPKVIDTLVNMSDGAQMFTRVVIPWPHDVRRSSCLVRSPYGTKMSQNFALVFMLANGHVAVMQESRGTWRSGGVFNMWKDSGQDFIDTTAWIRAQGWSNGEFYSMGVSADGIEVGEEVRATPKHLYGQYFLWTTANGHHFAYPGGAYRKDLMEGYFRYGLGGQTGGVSYKVVLPETKQHETLDPWWYNLTDRAPAKGVTNTPKCVYPDVKWPVVLQTAWWDLFHETALESWDNLRELSDAGHRDDHMLIVAPLGHQIVAHLEVGNLESARLRAAEANALVVGFEQAVEFWKWTWCSAEGDTCKCEGRVKFGKHHTWSEAKQVQGSIACDVAHFGDPAVRVRKECQCQEATGPLRRRLGRVNLFVMGSFGVEVPHGPGNYWTSLNDLPKIEALPLYLSQKNLRGVLARTPSQISDSVTYAYDPSDAPPMEGGNNLPLIGNITFSGPAELSARESRSDVLVFTSEPLEEPLAIVGLVSATLYVSSSAPDTDFFVTLSDVHPGTNQSWLVRYGIQRMRWRDSEIAKSEPMIRGKVYEANVQMGRTAYIFAKGHRVRVSVSSAADPYFNPTSNTGFNEMVEQDVKPIVARNSVHFSPHWTSKLILPVVPLSSIPANNRFSWFGPVLAQSAATTEARDEIII